tara:strand:+ start:89 stop:286 length:198 start_codon:yes stop_codon:yes gene_type:complete
MMTDKDIETEEAIKEYRQSGQQLEDWMDCESAWVDDFYQQEVQAGNVPGPDGEDEKTFKRQRSSE